MNTPQEARERLEALVQKKKRTPSWLDRATLEDAPLSWSDGEEVSREERILLLTLLMQEGPDAFEPTHWSIFSHLDPSERASVSEAIEAAWLAHGAKPSHKWAIYQLAAMNASQRLLERAPELVEMATTGSYKRALWYIETLSRHDHPDARAWIYELALYAPYESALHRAAQDWHRHLLALSGLSESKYLEDIDLYIRENHDESNIEMPDFQPGVTTLSLFEQGDHVVTLLPGSFDLGLRQLATHKLTEGLPEQSMHHDPALWQRSRARFGAYELSLEAFLATWRANFEHAMISGRPYPLALLHQRFLNNRLMTALIETLLWRTTPVAAVDRGEIVRFMEGSCFDAEEDEVELPIETTTLYLVHPLDMTEEERITWGVNFADNDILPLFDQLTREIYTPQTHPLSGLHYRKYLTNTQRFIDMLFERGWRHGETNYGNFSRSYHLLPGRDVRIWLRHGELSFQGVSYTSNQQGILGVDFENMQGRARQLKDISPIVYSETYALVKELSEALRHVERG